MLVIPAIDLKGGECVRLEQGKMDLATVFSENPSAMAGRWEAEGAKLLHVVDLDGAFGGSPRNRKAIENIISSVAIPVQVGGGIRDFETIESHLDSGIDRVILGTSACQNPDFAKEACRRFPGRIAVGIDALKGMVAVKGWTCVTDQKATELAKKFEGFGVKWIIYTDISRDGMLSGLNFKDTEEVAKSITIPLVASGGVSTIEDIKKLLEIEKYGIEGVIVGRSIYAGSLDLGESIRLTEGKREQIS